MSSIRQKIILGAMLLTSMTSFAFSSSDILGKYEGIQRDGKECTLNILSYRIVENSFKISDFKKTRPIYSNNSIIINFKSSMLVNPSVALVGESLYSSMYDAYDVEDVRAASGDIEEGDKSEESVSFTLSVDPSSLNILKVDGFNYTRWTSRFFRGVSREDQSCFELQKISK